MLTGYDIAYGLALLAAAPFWMIKPSARRKVLRALRERMGKDLPRRGAGPAVMIHAVSLGEINATPSLVAALASRRAGLKFIVSTTTDTGYARGKELYGQNPNVTLVRYPLDFSPAVNRLLTRLRPDLVVLMELEVWPNFIHHCLRRHIPVILINGRLTTSSFRNYRRAKLLVAPMFRGLNAICAQDQTYADRFIRLGAGPGNVSVTGTMKFDTARIQSRDEGAGVLASSVGLRPGLEPIWVCGSTGPGEEQLILRQYRQLLQRFKALRLVIVPRHPERFDDVAAQIARAGFAAVRRSVARNAALPLAASASAVVLGDTMGELRSFYGIANVVFVGRSLVDLGPRQHGSDMIEPAALAKPVVVGPYTHNFADAMDRFQTASALRIVHSESELGQVIADLLADPPSAIAMGLAAQRVVQAQQGATARHVKIILEHLPDCGR